MIRTGAEYRDSLRDSREIFIDGERVNDVTTHPDFQPLVDIRARIYDMQHHPATHDVMTVPGENGEINAIGNALPHTQDDWRAKRRQSVVLDGTSQSPCQQCGCLVGAHVHRPQFPACPICRIQLTSRSARKGPMDVS